MSMTKQDLTNEVVKVTGLTKKDTMKTIDELFNVMAEAIAAGEEIAIYHFGKFKSVVKAGRTGVNPQNPSEKIEIPSKKYPKFTPSSVLKKLVAE